LEDIKKRTIRYYERVEEAKTADKAENEVKEVQEVLDDQYIFRHFYSNKRSLIKQHIRETREELQAIELY